MYQKKVNSIKFLIISMLIVLSSCSSIENKDDIFDPQDPDISNPSIPFVPKLEANSWTSLQTRVPSSTRTSREGVIVVSDDNNKVYVSFRYLEQFFVYKWNGVSWEQQGTTVTVDNYTSLTLHNNTPYITYRHNNQGFIKKLNNNQWIDVYSGDSPIMNARYLSLYSEKKTLYMMYIDTDHKLHVKYLVNNSWVSLGDIPKDTYSASSNNGIKMAFYNNIPYIALADRFSSDPRILWLKDNRWQNISDSVIRNRYNANSDYSFHIDSKGTIYFSYIEGFVAPTGNFEIIKFQNGTWAVNQPFGSTQVFGNEIVLVQDKLYITYTKSTSDFVGVAGAVELGQINTSTLAVENAFNSKIAGDTISTHSSLAVKYNQFFSFYLSGQSYVVKGALVR